MNVMDDEPVLLPESPAPAAEPAGEEPATPASSIADGTVRSLDPRAVRVERAAGWIVTASISLPVLIGAVIVFLVEGPPSWVKGLVFLGWSMGSTALAFAGHRLPVVQHRHTSYKVDAQALEIRRGIFWRQALSVPRSRVQHTDVSQGPLERANGLGTLVIFTAGTQHARIELSGLDHATALQIRDHMMPREAEDAV